MSVLQSKFTNTITNQRKNEVWKAIPATINAIGVESRSVQEVKDKWKNLQSAAKKEFAGFRKEICKTGGGPAPRMPSFATVKIIEMFKESPSFASLEGFETANYLRAEFPSFLLLHSFIA